MLTIVVPGDEFFDEEKQEFTTRGDVTLDLEHSLVSLSKWESITEKPFLIAKDKTAEEALLYVECMCLTPNIPPGVFSKLSKENFDQINEYISAKKTATWFNEPRSKRGREVITSELIYYWLISFNIPFEVENWHLNRLLTLLKICDLKNQKPKKMTRNEIFARNRELNAQRKAQLKSTG